VSFIDEHEQVFRVEPVCRLLTQHGLPIAPSMYYAAKSRPPSARAVRDAWLEDEITRVWKENYEVYGADKVWLELNRHGTAVAQCTVERLMRELGLQGAQRTRIRTTAPGKGRGPGRRPAQAGLYRSGAEPAMGRRLHLRGGLVYIFAFVTDVYSRGHRGMVGRHAKRARLVLDALQMALWRRDGRRTGPGPPQRRRIAVHLVHFTTHLLEAGLDASVATPTTTRIWKGRSGSTRPS
jgi:putative transposase